MGRFMRTLLYGLLELVVICGGFVGCTGQGEDQVLEYDPEVSEQKSKEYQKQMEEAMKQQQGAQGGGPR